MLLARKINLAVFAPVIFLVLAIAEYFEKVDFTRI